MKKFIEPSCTCLTKLIKKEKKKIELIDSNFRRSLACSINGSICASLLYQMAQFPRYFSNPFRATPIGKDIGIDTDTFGIVRNNTWHFNVRGHNLLASKIIVEDSRIHGT